MRHDDVVTYQINSFQLQDAATACLVDLFLAFVCWAGSPDGSSSSGTSGNVMSWPSDSAANNSFSSSRTYHRQKVG